MIGTEDVGLQVRHDGPPGGVDLRRARQMVDARRHLVGDGFGDRRPGRAGQRAASAMSSDAAGGGVPGRCHARSRARPRRRSSRCPPANPVAPVTRVGPSAMSELRARAGPVLLLVVLAERRLLFLDSAATTTGSRDTTRRSRASPSSNVSCGAQPSARSFVVSSAYRRSWPGPIGDRPDERRRATGQLEDAMREVDVLDFVAAADVVDLARAARAR